jgi:hypothetical protein
MTLDSPRAWYVLWWSGWTLATILLAYAALVRPITRRLDALLAAVRP